MTKIVKLAAILGTVLGGATLSGCAEHRESMMHSQQVAEQAAADAKQAAAEAKAAAEEAKTAAERASRSYGRSLRK